MSRPQIDGLVCPELDLSLFCRRVADRELSAVMDAAGMESSLLYRECRERAGRHTFRAGTKQRRYVEDLQHLVYLLLNGSYPSYCDDRFFLAVAPLVSTLLLKCRIGNLHEVFSPENVEAHIQREGERDPMLATILAARDAGKIAAQELMASWREERGIREQYSYQASAVLNLAVSH